MIGVEVVADIAGQAAEEHRLLPVVPQRFDRFDDHLGDQKSETI